MKIEIKVGETSLQNIDLSDEVSLLENGTLTFLIGRSEECTIQLDDPKISREQGELIFREKCWFVKNNSPNVPMLLNGIAIKESEIANEDIISLARFNLVFRFKAISLGDKNKKIEPEIVSDNLKTETELGFKEEIVLQEKVEIKELPTEMKVAEQGETHLEDNNLAEESPFNESPFGHSSEEVSTPEENIVTSDSPTEAITEEVQDQGNYPVSEADEQSENGTKVFRSFAKFDLEIFGEFAPYDRYTIELPETYIGRDPKTCQIVLNDQDVSSVHAVIRKNYVTCSLEDLKSSNGTLLNGERINKAELTNNDEFVIGGTTFTVRVSSDLIKSEDERLMPVETNQEVEIEEVVEVHVDDEEDADAQGLSLLADGENIGGEAQPPEKSIIKRLLRDFKDPKKKKKMILIGAVIFMGIMMLLPDEPTDTEKTKNSKKSESKKEGTEESGENKSGNEKTQISGDNKKKERPLSKDQKSYVEGAYQLAKELHSVGKYSEAMMELDKILAITSNYKETKSLKESCKEGLAHLEELERKKREEEERRVLLQKVKELVEKAKEATKEKNVQLAEALFNQILSMDPENFDVPQLKIEIDTWKKEQERIELEKAEKEADRKRKVSQLQPSKSHYFQKEWFKAINKLEEFMKIKDMDEDLSKDAQSMLEESRKNLSEIISPILGKARSLKEGQDLKGAYENYMQVLTYDPINVEALEETVNIRDLLNTRSRRVYREAIISESLSLFSDAKEKFQEVQQISPTDSDYYRKSTEKLKEYLE